MTNERRPQKVSAAATPNPDFYREARLLVVKEVFCVLAGTRRAVCGGANRDVGPGDLLVLRPGTEHVVESTGRGKLYCLTMMTPNEGFAELIRNGKPVETTEDLAIITGERR